MENKIFKIYNILLFVLVLSTSFASWFWNTPILFDGIIIIIAVFLSIKLLEYENGSISNNSILAGLFFLFVCVWQTTVTFLGVVFLLIKSVLIAILVSLPDLKKKQILTFQTKTLSVFLTISLTVWLIDKWYPLPNFGILMRDGYENVTYGSFNYIFFIKSAYYAFDVRFHSIFLEPGHLGLIASFYIFANQYNFKDKYVVILSIVLLFTLSLAGYVLFLVGFILCASFSAKFESTLIKFLLFFVVVFLFWQIGISYNNGDNYINQLIISRLSYDNNGFEGDNRTTEMMLSLYERMWEDGTILTGISYENFKKIGDTSAGLVSFMVEKGIIGVVIIFIFYYFMSKDAENRKWVWITLLFYCISSYQRTYFTWFSYIVPFICGCISKQSKNINKI